MKATDFPSRAAFLQAARGGKPVAHPARRSRVEPVARPSVVQAKPMPAPVDERRLYACKHRGGSVATTQCSTCTGVKKVEVYACTVHGKCTVRNLSTERDIHLCQVCNDRNQGFYDLPFAGFKNAYPGGTGMVIGLGTTRFDYEQLRKSAIPTFFINTAVQLGVLLPHEHHFWFAQDEKQRACYSRCASIACLPGEKDIVKKGDGWFKLSELTKVMFWRSSPKGHEYLLDATRDQMAMEQRLYGGREGAYFTINPLLHFAHFAGFEKLLLVGCDGLDVGYDERLENLTQQPYVRGSKYGSARREQDRVAAKLGIALNYVGTPV